MRVASAAVPPFFKNGYLVSSETSKDAVLIDPGDEVDALLAAARKEQLSVGLILLTHAHVDHVTGVGRAKVALGAPVWLHEADLFLYNIAVQQGRLFGLDVEQPPPVDHFYRPGERLTFGDCVVDVRETPGHSP